MRSANASSAVKTRMSSLRLCSLSLGGFPLSAAKAVATSKVNKAPKVKRRQNKGNLRFPTLWPRFAKGISRGRQRSGDKD
jgi:hypothetical protein